jgi:phosphoribosyl-ATP pyrophosphohydrolase
MKLEKLYELIESRFEDLPEGSYIAALKKKGLDRIAQKVGEEATEVVISSKNPDSQKTIEEMSDLVFHLLILMKEKGIRLEDIETELEKRNG